MRPREEVVAVDILAGEMRGHREAFEIRRVERRQPIRGGETRVRLTPSVPRERVAATIERVGLGHRVSRIGITVGGSVILSNLSLTTTDRTPHKCRRMRHTRHFLI
jgi:hypothetical protein